LNLILIGAPGSGKGTQAEILKNKFDFTHISTGDLLRSEVMKGSDLGLRIKSIIDQGQLVDDNTVLELFQQNLNLDSCSYIFDGFPRTVEQCKLLESNVLKGASYIVIYFEIDVKQVVDRIVNRRIAPKSGKIYNLLFDPPKNSGVCDVSGEKLIHRDDDHEEVVKNRIKVYEDSVKNIVSYYRDLGVLRTVDASADPESVNLELIKLINS
jgi:adenylate kinase